MEYYFYLEYLYIQIHMGFTCLKSCSFPYNLQKTHEKRSGESRMTACQTLWGQNQKLQKLIFLDAELH